MDNDSFEAVQYRSPSSSDLALAMKVYAQLAVLGGIQEGYVDAAEFLIVSNDGYVVGNWWWDSETETWRFDLKRHGEVRS